MKNILYITLGIFALLIAGCATPTDPEKPEKTYPYTVGTWTVQSPTSADWNGVKAKTMSADTVVIDHPGQQELSITRDNSLVHGFNIHFSDTSITHSMIIEGKTRVSLPDSTFTGASNYGGHMGIDWNYDKGYLSMTISLNVNCSFSGQANRIYLEFRNADDTGTYKFYEFKTGGFLTAVKDVAGC